MKKNQLAQLLKEGYLARRFEDLKISQEWESTLLDGLSEDYHQTVRKGSIKKVGRGKNI